MDVSLPPKPAVYLLLVSLPTLILCEVNSIYIGHFLGKPISSLAFLSGAIYLTLHEPSPYRNFITWGLFFSLIGDILLIPSRSEYAKDTKPTPRTANKPIAEKEVSISASFQAGIGAFAAAHIAYILAFLEDTQSISWPVFASVAVASLLAARWLGVLYPKPGSELEASGGLLMRSNVLGLSVPDDMRHLVCVYTLIISCMVASAVSTVPVLQLPTSMSMQSQRTLGAVMFVISDIFVAKDAFSKKRVDKGGYFWLQCSLGWGLYFWGQMVLAGTLNGV
ncbi:YhhN domain-containing protein [Nannizzia gypsea CBS 118893]|uniref:YhhN domain-containing protein n=1 Tax=Arthroderma gypseum (strain ATCC MYA-4604 / CBS 118893) TaxID=535722 RepID=E4UUH2_ARTGP|nr:YhhN domain-containing protein [Nannizzia gypsea CBS 118893]EFR00939.1 YhhN domain-containing protein [Nannizzia gypsea CBS 118893]